MERALALLLVSFLLAAPAAAFDQEEPDREVRDPIHLTGHITSYTESLARTNGVRSGTGTADDPFVVSGWSIKADETSAIYIGDSSFHYIVEDVAAQGDASGHSAVRIDRAPHVTLRDVEIRGPRGLSMDGSDVLAKQILVEGSEVCVDIRASRFEAHGLRVVGCPGRALTSLASEVVIDELAMLGGGIEASDGGSLEVTRAAIRLAYVDHVRNGINVEMGMSSLLRDVSVVCESLPGDPTGHGFDADLRGAETRWSGLRVQGCGTGLSLYGERVDPPAAVELRDVAVADGDEGIECSGCRAEIHGLNLTNVTLGFYVQGGDLKVYAYTPEDVAYERLLSSGTLVVHGPVQAGAALGTQAIGYLIAVALLLWGAVAVAVQQVVKRL